ncbi:MAG: hypothetical protein R6V03_11265, partial [Kiritimatiellia bacterium]
DFKRGQVAAALGKGLHTADFKGIDTSRSSALYVLIPEIGPNEPPEAILKEKPGFVFSASVTGEGKAYLDALSRNLGPGSMIEGVHHYKSAGRAPGSGRDVYVLIRDGRVLLGEEPGAVKEVNQHMSGKTVDRILKVPGTVKIGLDARACLPMVRGASAQMMKGLKSRNQNPAMPQVKFDTAAIVQAETEMITELLKQLNTLTIGLGADSSRIQISSRLAPFPETDLARALGSLKKPADDYMTILPQDSLYALVGNGMNVLDMFTEPFGDLLQEMYSGMGPQFGKLAKTSRRTMEQMAEMYRGDFAVGVLRGDDGKTGLVEVFAITDPTKVMDIQEENLKAANEIHEQMKSGLTMVRGTARTYKDIRIQPYVYRQDSSEQSASPDMPALGMGILRKMNWELAFAGENMIYAVGPSSVMNKTIDHFKAGGKSITDMPAFRSLFPEFRKKPTEAFSLPLLKLIKGLLSLSPMVQPRQIAILPETDGGIAGYSTKEGNDRVSVTRIDIAELKALKEAGPVLKMLGTQAFMGLMMNAGTGPGGANPFMQARGQARRNACINNLRMINAAKAQVALERNLKDGDIVNPEWIKEYLRGGVIPSCPAGGAYKINPAGADPECSVDGHSLK